MPSTKLKIKKTIVCFPLGSLKNSLQFVDVVITTIDPKNPLIFSLGMTRKLTMRKIGIINLIKLESSCYSKMHSYKSGILYVEDLFTMYGMKSRKYIKENMISNIIKTLLES